MTMFIPRGGPMEMYTTVVICLQAYAGTLTAVHVDLMTTLHPCMQRSECIMLQQMMHVASHASKWSLQGENELEEDLLDQVQSCIGAVLEQFGDAAMPLMEGLMPQIGVLLTPKSSVEEKRIGICIMDDIMEHTQEGGLYSVATYSFMLELPTVFPSNLQPLWSSWYCLAAKCPLSAGQGVFYNTVCTATGCSLDCIYSHSMLPRLRI